MRRAAWIVPVGLVLGGWIALLWVIRPTWGYCVDGVEASASYCDTGTSSTGAIAGTIVLAVLFLVFVVLAVAVRGPTRTRVLTVSVVVLGIACAVTGWLEVFVIREAIPPFPG